MSLQLPPPVLRKLEQTLAQWQQWRGSEDIPGAPHLVGPLQGISNYTVLVQAAQQRFSIRLDRVNPAANGLNRQVEWRALEAAYSAGIAPRPRYFNPELGVLVCNYLVPDTRQDTLVLELAMLMREIHQLPPLHYRLDIAERIKRYQRQLRLADTTMGKALQETDLSITALLAQLSAVEHGTCLCHNDLNPDNLLRSDGKLYALDWEYCAVGNPWFDLAVASVAHGYDDQQQSLLLQHYLQRLTTSADNQLLQRWICVAHYLELLWYLSQRPDFHSNHEINARLTQLRSRLRDISRENY